MECLSSRTQVDQESLTSRASGNRMSCSDAAGGSVASQGVVPLWTTWQLLAGKPGPVSGFRTAGQATSGSAMAGFPGLERKFRRGRPRGEECVSVREKGENRPKGLGSPWE